jgi:hypothetical protein
MQTILLVFLVVVDFGLLACVYILSKKKSEAPHVLKEMAAERKIIEELRTSLKDQSAASQKILTELTEKATVLVTEAEIEYKNIKELLGESTGSLVEEIEEKLNNPIEFITKKCDTVQRSVDTLKKEKDGLLRAIKKAETLTKFFNQKIPYEDLLEEIEDKKYTDARHMLSKGIDPETVASQLNMPETEVALLVSLS